MRSRRRRLIPLALTSAGLACLTLAGVALADGSDSSDAAPSAQLASAVPAARDGLAADISLTQQHLREVPRDWTAWASLGLAYVQQAKVTVDPTYYPKATAALHRSLALNSTDNYLAIAGQGALAAARHDFRGARAWARRGLRINPYSSLLYGALCDAYTQLGRYHAASRAAAHMDRLDPSFASASRLSYAAELRGDVAAARRFMRHALAVAASPSDTSFARYYLAELDRNAGHPAAALRHIARGLDADPQSAQLLEGRAKAEAALGRLAAAQRDFAAAVNRVPQPSYVLEYGEFLQSLGHAHQADAQYAVFRTEEKLFTANGVALDTDETLFEADHGDPAAAVTAGRRGVAIRPFVEMHDAYGWALHQAGRDTAALREAQLATATGMRNALFYFHRGMIERSLSRTTSAAHDLHLALAIDPHFSPMKAPIARRTLAAMSGPR